MNAHFRVNNNETETERNTHRDPRNEQDYKSDYASLVTYTVKSIIFHEQKILHKNKKNKMREEEIQKHFPREKLK